MTYIPVFRANHLLPFIGLLRQIGVPIERELVRARLPSCLEETPDAYINLGFAFDFLMRCAAREGIDDLGFEAGWLMSLEDLAPEMVGAICAAPTIKTRLETFVRFASLEANTLGCRLQPEGDVVRVCLHEELPPGADTRISEWQSLKALIEVVRSGQGPKWNPSQICLRSPQKVHVAVRSQLDDVDIRVNQPVSSFLVSAEALARPVCWRSLEVARQSLTREPAGIALDSVMETLRAVLAPYLLSGYPKIDLAAEIVGTSKRTLQRMLCENQTSYSELLENLRFELAASLLADPDLKIIDIALQLGYEHSPNFSRAFRRISGLTPQQYRKSRIAH